MEEPENNILETYSNRTLNNSASVQRVKYERNAKFEIAPLFRKRQAHLSSDETLHPLTPTKAGLSELHCSFTMSIRHLPCNYEELFRYEISTSPSPLNIRCLHHILSRIRKVCHHQILNLTNVSKQLFDLDMSTGPTRLMSFRSFPCVLYSAVLEVHYSHHNFRLLENTQVSDHYHFEVFLNLTVFREWWNHFE